MKSHSFLLERLQNEIQPCFTRTSSLGIYWKKNIIMSIILNHHSWIQVEWTQITALLKRIGAAKRYAIVKAWHSVSTQKMEKTMNQIRQWNGNANLRLYQSQIFSQWPVRDYFLVLSPTNDFFPFGNPDWHLQNQVGKRSNPHDFANLGRTTKLDVIKIIILILFIFDSCFLSHLQPAGYSRSQCIKAWDLLQKPWNIAVYFTHCKGPDPADVKWNILVLWIEIWFSGSERQSYCRSAAADVSFIWMKSLELS